MEQNQQMDWCYSADDEAERDSAEGSSCHMSGVEEEVKEMTHSEASTEVEGNLEEEEEQGRRGLILDNLSDDRESDSDVGRGQQENDSVEDDGGFREFLRLVLEGEWSDPELESDSEDERLIHRKISSIQGA